MMTIGQKLEDLIKACQDYQVTPIPTKTNKKDQFLSPFDVPGKTVSKDDCVKVLQQYFINKYKSEGKDTSSVEFLINNDFSPMLAAKLSDCKMTQEDVFNLDENNYIAQTKLDGNRILIYKSANSDELHFYSRNLSVVDYLPIDYKDNIYTNVDFSKLRGISFMVDCELVVSQVPDNVILESYGLPVDTTQLNLTTALLSTESGTEEFQKLYPLKFWLFDVVMKDGVSYLDEPLYRRQIVVNEMNALLVEAGLLIEQPLNNRKLGLSIRDFHKKMLMNNEEGSIVKRLDATYCTNGTRSHKAWIKLKRTATESLVEQGLGDTIDAFITGYENKKDSSYNSWRVGSIELSVYLTDDNDNYICDENGYPISKVIAYVGGLTDEDAKNLSIPDVNNPGMCCLDPMSYGRVYEVTGQDISPKSNTLMHAKIIRERFDKQSSDCKLRKSFIESQVM